MPIILDVDPGVDDALAIMFALRTPELDVLALSIVSGNVPVDQGVENALRLLHFLEHPQIPVFAGAERPLVREPVRAPQVHGPHGLGAVSLPPAELHANGDALGFIIDTLKARGEEITLVALGPLTNLALAEAQVPGVLKKAKQIVVMGGAIRAPGNVSALGEFNFYSDPDAARTVVRSGANLLLVPLDVTGQVAVGREEIRRLVSTSPSATASFFEKVTEPALSYMESLYGKPQLSLHDPVAVVAAFQPHLFEIETHWLDVQVGGELGAGQLVSDRRQFSDHGRRQGTATECCVGVKADLVRSHLMQTTFLTAQPA